MSRPYRAPNKRIIMRGRGGRFRRTTMADFGLATDPCPHCRAINPRALDEARPDTCPKCGESLRSGMDTAEMHEDYRTPDGFIDPFKFNRKDK
jgi:ssDNA-binding Zn-finger/Zn-ribbon topoisomerase 1